MKEDKRVMIGKKISPILVEVENTLWEFEANVGFKPEYTNEGFRAAIKILMSALLDKMFELQNIEGMPLSERMAMADKAGKDFRQLIKTYTNIDTHEFYEPKREAKTV